MEVRFGYYIKRKLCSQFLRMSTIRVQIVFNNSYLVGIFLLDVFKKTIVRFFACLLFSLF